MVLGAVAGWGTWRIADGSLTREGTPIRVGLVQGNIAQEIKWRPEEARTIFTTYMAMTRDVVRRGAQFVIWPESSTPFTFEETRSGNARCATSRARWVSRSCSEAIRRPRPSGGQPQIETHYNAAFQLAPDGTTSAVYRKIHLVPFGEFVPMADWLTVFPPLVQTLAGFAPFSPGDSMVDAARRDASGEHGDLLRSGLPVAGA